MMVRHHDYEISSGFIHFPAGKFHSFEFSQEVLLDSAKRRFSKISFGGDLNCRQNLAEIPRKKKQRNSTNITSAQYVTV